jgi:hypothetical protein
MMARNYDRHLNKVPRCGFCNVELHLFYEGKFCRRCLMTVGPKELEAYETESALYG